MSPPALTSVLLVVTVGWMGCGNQTGSADAAGVEDLIKRELAKALVEEHGRPDEAQIRRVAAQLGVSCEPGGRSDYRCVIDYGRELGDRHCTVRPDRGLTRLESIRCGGAEAPVMDEQFVDCASVGRVVSASDPEGDVNENGLPLPPETAASPELGKADLRGVRVAATPERLCVQWETLAPIAPKYGLNFWAYPRAGGAEERLSLTVSMDPGESPDVGIGPYGSTSGRVGTDGNVTSVVVEADDLPKSLRPALASSFTFAAHTAWVVGRTHPDQAYGDDLDVSSDLAACP